MLVKWHIYYGGFLALILYFIGFPLYGVILVFLSSFLIDIDHYFYYIYKRKDINPFHAYKEYMRLWKEMKRGCFLGSNLHDAICIFHGVEVIIIIFLLSLIPQLSFLYFVGVGISLHLFQDIIGAISIGSSPLKAISQTYNLISIRNKKPVWNKKW